MQFGILGPLQARRDDGTLVALGGPRQRAVLARLLVDAGRVVSADRLIEDVWEGRPPPMAAKTLQKYVSELRKALPSPVLRTVGGGYVADVDDDALDARRFERLIAGRRFAAALALWRGDVLADLGGAAFAMPERSRLDELRLFAIEARIEQELAEGRHAEVSAELADLVDANPLRERLVGLQMLALYRSGRQVEALRAFDRHRRHLVDDVGVEPDAELRRLQGAILRHDPSLDLGLGSEQAHEVADGDARGNLPLALTSFVGRADEVAANEQALLANRLVTLIGPAGVGKTRLAVEVGAAVGDRFSGGVWMVDLAPVGSPDLVAATVASGMGIDTRHAPDDRAAVVGTLAHRRACLLVLDNCEHLAEPCAALVEGVLRGGRSARVLATSRRPLGVAGEYVRPIRPLPEGDALVLLTDRARLVGAEVDPDIAREICGQLDGVPLAIELVASQLRVMAPGEVAGRLHQQLSFHGAGASISSRQRTLGDTVQWSYDLLPEAVHASFAKLGVFASSLTLTAAEAVCADHETTDRDVLGNITTLLDHSLLVRDPAPAPSSRYRLLETLRLFALERLTAAGGVEQARRAHAMYYLSLAEESGSGLFGPRETEVRERLEVDESNLHAAAAWAAEHDHDVAARLILAMWPFWDARWGERHAVPYIETLLARADLDLTESQRAWALTVAADLVAYGGEARRAVPWATEATAAFRRLDDEHGLVHSLLALGSALGNQGALDRAESALDEGLDLAVRHSEPVVIGRALDRLSFVAARRGDYARAAELSRRELATWTALGSTRGEATALRHTAVALQHLGQYDEAVELCRRALLIWEDLHDRAAIAHVQLSLADIARLRGDLEHATALYDEALAEFEAIDDRRCTASTYKNLATIAAASGAHQSAAECFRRSVRVRYDLGDEAGLAECFEGLAGVELASGRPASGVTLLAAAASLRERTGSAASAAEAARVATLLTDAAR